VIENKTGKGKIFGRRIYDLDYYPKPARDLLPMKKYTKGTLISSRGCGGHCIFCDSWGSGFGAHSPKRTVDEMEELKYKYGFEEQYFHDDTFTWNYERVENICKEIQERGLEVHARVNARTDTVDDKLLYKMKEAKLDTLSFGFEHYDNEVLKKCGKGNIKTWDYDRVLSWCDDIGIDVVGYFILNLPGATKKTAKKTIDWAESKNLKRADFYPLVAYPGTVIWRYGDRFGLKVKKDYGYFQAGKDKPKLNVENKDFPNSEVLQLLEELK